MFTVIPCVKKTDSMTKPRPWQSCFTTIQCMGQEKEFWRRDAARGLKPGSSRPSIVKRGSPLSIFPPHRCAKAREEAELLGLGNVDFQVADVYRLPFDDGSFDHGFVCFLLEHLKDPEGALSELARVVRPGGTITVVEGDHGSAYFYPECEESRRAIEALIRIQAEMGGNSLVGRQLYPLLCEAGLRDVAVSPRMVYVDRTRPTLVEGFIRDTFTAMIEGVRDEAVSMGLLGAEEWEKGIRGLLRTMEPDGVFCYTFFKATGIIR